MYVLVVGCSRYWNDGIFKVLGPFRTMREAVDMENYCNRHTCDRYTSVITEIFELTKEL
jgi:hypothetical protein